MKPRALCISVSRKNQKYLDIINDYSLEFSTTKAQAIFKILDVFNKCREAGILTPEIVHRCHRQSPAQELSNVPKQAEPRISASIPSTRTRQDGSY